MGTQGIMMFNRGDKMVVQALVSLYSLRKYYNGDITFYVEDDYPHELDQALKYFGCNIVHLEKRHDLTTLVRKSSLFENPPYDKTLWIDLDTVIVGKVDEMFDYLNNADLCIPDWCGWTNNGGSMSKRLRRFKGIVEDRFLEEALKPHASINTGVVALRRSPKLSEFIKDVTELANKGAQARIFIPDETAMGLLIPSIAEWGLKFHLAPTDYNVSVLHDHGMSKDQRIIHFHGGKSVLNVPKCELFKATLKEMCNSNITNINGFLKYADKRLGQYLRESKDANFVDTTIVTACDNYYVDILRHTFPNWRKYKNIDKYPVIVFVHGLDIKQDPRLDFLRLPNVTMIPWSMPNAENHREEMLSAFVFGTAENVKTEYWLKLDADSYATDNRPFITDYMKTFAFCGHKWSYSRPDHIRKFDNFAKLHWKRKLKNAKPMIEEGRIEGNRFYHNVKRTISFIQLHKTKFTKFCVGLLRERRLPAPTQDTFMFFVANRFNPETVGVMNFKKQCGFTQGKGKLGAEYIKSKVEEVDNLQKGIVNVNKEEYSSDEY